MADTKTIEALREALEDEYRARATYSKVIEIFGPVRPFVNIVKAEDRHVRVLLDLFKRFGIEPPRDTWPMRVAAPPSLLEACRAGVEAEIENEAMYERIFSQISDPAVIPVMRRLQQASQLRHLPAFRRCLEREMNEDGSSQETCGLRQRRAQIRRRGS